MIRRLSVIALLPFVLWGCAPAAEAEETGFETELAAAETAKAALDAKREQLAAMVEAEDEAETEAREALAAEITADSNAFAQQIVTVINNSGMLQGEPLTEMQQRAVRLKSSEEMYVARQYIENIGNYERAIGIYEDALQLDPDNAELQAALEQARADQFMTEERFSQAKKGMNDKQVLELLGAARPNNIQEFDRGGRKTVAWLYPREDGGAAGVWFENKDGKLEVYEVKFDQVPAGG